jgi:[ribosomal protein S18]-alanine N-acetyltransferase
MPYYLEPMRLSDVPQVEAIERASFSSPWTRRAYEYDLTENPLAHYLVVRQGVRTPEEHEGQGEQGSLAPEAMDAGRQCEPLTWRQRIGAALSAVVQAISRSGIKLASSDVSPASGRTPVLGFVGIWMAVEEAHLVTIAVRQDLRRRGLGELLLIGALDLAAGLRASTVFLEARVSNDPAKRLYDKYGFVLSRIRKAYYSDNGEDALEMAVEGIDRPQYQSRLRRLKKMLAEKMAEPFPDEEPAVDVEQ